MAKDPVTQLKELSDKEKWIAPEYETTRDESFPDNSCRFLTYVKVNGGEKIFGILSTTKRESKKSCAGKALVIYGNKEEVKTENATAPKSDPAAKKDPVSLLNEKANQEKFTIQYTDYESSGPPHKPAFIVSVVVDGSLCDAGEGSTKKLAKQIAAQKALTAVTNRTLLNKPKYTGPAPAQAKNGAGKDPVSCLEEYCRPRGISYEFNIFPRNDGQKRSQSPIPSVLIDGNTGQGNWSCITQISGCRFPVRSGQTKDEAKKLSAKVAMRIYLNEKIDLLRRANEEARFDINKKSYSNFADQTEALVFSVYKTCHETLTENFMSQKVLAAFVMKKGNTDVGTVVSLATGNRTILGDHVTTVGDKVLDSHAEVLARRALKRYFFRQIQSLNDDACIFEMNPGNTGVTLKKNITFHLYISRPPCGDASEFQSIGTDGLKKKHQKRQGVLRTKIEKGEGTIPTVNLDDHRIKIHSCSDKICQWNVVGLQGALLSTIISPVVYLQSIIIGSYRSQQASHFTRALYGRLEGSGLQDKLPHGFRHNRCQIFTTSGSFGNEKVYNSKSSRFSINWSLGDEEVETLDGTLGCAIGSFVKDPVSRICKKGIYKNYLDVSKYTPQHGYAGLKQESRVYQKAKLALKDAFEAMNLYQWKGFGRNVDMFNMEGAL